MDRRVKERLVGATILVVLIVLIVPELLSGPKRPRAAPLNVNLPAPTRNVSVDLATSKATSAPQAPDAASAASADASGVATPDVATPGVATPGVDDTPTHAAEPPPPPTVTTLRAQAPVAPALESQSSSPTSSPEMARSGASNQPRAASPHAWAVQLGSFASKVNADKLVHQLKTRVGSSVYVISSGSGPSLRYRVRMGPLPDRNAAERAVLKLKASGHAATVVTPAS